MITLSVCMIVRDEELYLARCLMCIKDIADEIIIVDTGSVDKTKEVAAEYTTAVFDFEWEDDFSAARNYSFSKATKEYIMWLDADDIISLEEQKKLLRLKEILSTDTDVVYMKYVLGTNAEGDADCLFWRERLVKRGRNFMWHDPVHEYLLCDGKIMRADISVTHTHTHESIKRNRRIFENYMAKGNELSARQCYFYARELFLEGEYDKAIKYYDIFLRTKGSVRSTYMNACVDLSICYEKKGDDDNCLKSLLRYFEIDVPRAEICCSIGYYYKNRGCFDKAAAWFEIAPYTNKPEDSIGLMIPKYWGYIPYMELCACYYKMGDLNKAIYYNEKAAECEPKDKNVLHNRRFLVQQKAKQ